MKKTEKRECRASPDCELGGRVQTPPEQLYVVRDRTTTAAILDRDGMYPIGMHNQHISVA